MDRALCLNCGTQIAHQPGGHVAMGFRRGVAGVPDYVVALDGIEVHRCSGPTQLRVRWWDKSERTPQEQHPSAPHPKTARPRTSPLFVADSEGENTLATTAFDASVHDDASGGARLVLKGVLDRTAVAMFATAVMDTCIDEPTELVIDLTALQHCDASGLRTLVRARHFCLANGVAVKMIGVSEETRVEDVLPSGPRRQESVPLPHDHELSVVTPIQRPYRA